MAYVGATSGAVIVSVGMNMMVKVMYQKLVKHVRYFPYMIGA